MSRSVPPGGGDHADFTGIPLIFQGQEMLKARAFGLNTPTNMDFSRAEDARFKGIAQMYRDLIALRQFEGRPGA